MLKEGSGRAPGRFWKDFEGGLGEFLMHGFGKTMIRATKGISMDGWMDGVDLIICVAIWMLYK